MAYETTKIDNAVEWNNRILDLPDAHILQSWEWGGLKQQYGWEMEPFLCRNMAGDTSFAAMLLKRSLAFSRLRTPLSILYIPRGPVANWASVSQHADILIRLEEIARKAKAISIKIDPEVILAKGVPGAQNEEFAPHGRSLQQMLEDRGWVYSSSQVQFRNTVWIDLTSSEEECLARMKQKTRYNIRLAGRKGVEIRQGDQSDIPLLYKMYLETSLRDGFVIRSKAYYRSVWSDFFQRGMATFLLAEYKGETLGGLILFTFGRKSWYFYGMSTLAHNEKMPNYLLQWEAMRAAKRLNCDIFDMWGAPETFDETDRMWGVYRFKAGFGGEVVRTLGAWDYAPRKGVYTLFHRILPRLLSIMRTQRISQAQQELN